MLNNINLDNYTADLSDLAHQIQEFEQERDRLGDMADPELVHRLERVTKSLKNCATLYTDLLEETLKPKTVELPAFVVSSGVPF